MRSARSETVISKLRNGLIVSCQAPPESPLSGPGIIAAMARVAENQGAVGVRIDGPRNIRAVRRSVAIPIIGIEKLQLPNSPVYITPTWESLQRVSKAGADIIALDCTRRRRPAGQSLRKIVQDAKKKLGAVIMADIATPDEGFAAADLGADLLGTTLYGYTAETRDCREPGFEVLTNLVSKVKVPVIVEGRIHTPEQLRRAFDLGAYAVVVGTAITNMEWLAAKFIAATPRAGRGGVRSDIE